MGTSLISELLARQPEWFFFWSSLIILSALAAGAYWIILGTKRYADSMGRENRLIKLQDEYNSIREENKYNSSLTYQVSTALENARSYLISLNNIKSSNDAELIASRCRQLIQRIVEAAASDVKFNPGEKHRCALWVEKENELVLFFGSTGFADSYFSGRKLDLFSSIAGKAYRRNETLNKPDVNDDEDWSPNPNTRHQYKSLICIPLERWGVLTIDGFKPMSKETVLIGELYAEIIQSVLHEFTIAQDFLEMQAEVASATEKENN